MSLGCVVLTCHTVAFVLCLLAFSWLVLLHHTPHSFLCHVSSDEGCVKRDNKNFIFLRVARFLQSMHRKLSNIGRQMMDARSLCKAFGHDKVCVEPLYGTDRWYFYQTMNADYRVKGTKWWSSETKETSVCSKRRTISVQICLIYIQRWCNA